MELTIAIITKNRPYKLVQCLNSIYNQNINCFTILVIDNDEQKTAMPVFKYFKSKNKISIEYLCESMVGYTHARNCALRICSTQYLGFVDDDCILTESWAENGLKAIKKYNSTYVVGLTRESARKSLFSKVERYIYTNWEPDYYDKESFEIVPIRLDTKNVIFNAIILKTNNILFDKRFNKYGGEDTDLGLQIKQFNFKGYYVNDMVLYHHDNLNFKSFMKKAYHYGYNCYSLYYKWRPKNECIYWNYYKNYKFFNNRKQFIELFYNIKLKNKIMKIVYFILIKLFNFFFLKGFFKKKRDINTNKTFTKQLSMGNEEY